MKRLFYFVLIFGIILSTLFYSGCFVKVMKNTKNIRDYRQDMRTFVQEISSYAKNINSEFLIIPQNGQELITDTGYIDGKLQYEYINAIDATGRESMFFGYNKDNKATPPEDNTYLLNLCHLYEKNGVEVLTTDYCSAIDKIDTSYEENYINGFISFAADQRDLNTIPKYPALPYNANKNDIRNLSQGNNFLYLINSEKYTSKASFIASLSTTNYDILIIDLFHNEVPFTKEDINFLKNKKNGGKRLVICYLSIGEAEDYRYYWKGNWYENPPKWMEDENKDWKGNYKVQYWHTDWKNIIFGTNDSYIHKILDSDYDGVYLDIIDGFEYFE